MATHLLSRLFLGSERRRSSGKSIHSFSPEATKGQRITFLSNIHDSRRSCTHRAKHNRFAISAFDLCTNGAQTQSDLYPNLTSALRALHQARQQNAVCKWLTLVFLFSRPSRHSSSTSDTLFHLSLAGLNIAPALLLRNINTDVVQKRLNYSCSAHNRPCRRFFAFSSMFFPPLVRVRVS